MRYFEVYYLDDDEKIEEFFCLCSDRPFPLISNREIVTIDDKEYMVFRREQMRSKTEITVNYYVVAA